MGNFFIRLRRRPWSSDHGGMCGFFCFGGFRSAEETDDTVGVSPRSFIPSRRLRCVFSLFFALGLMLFWFLAKSQVEAAGSFHVRNYGALGDGETNDQAAIQEAIDTAAGAGGGEVIFDGGKTYYTGNLFMKSNVNWVIEAGSRIKASTWYGDYTEHDCDDGSCGDVAPLIFADNLTNIAIRGGGVIEGVGNNFYCPGGQKCDWDDCSYGPGLVFWGDISGGTIENVRMENANNAELVIAESNNILVENIILRTLTNHMCNDPFDIFGSQNVTIRNNDIAGGDDNICLKIRYPYNGFMMKKYNEEVMHDITVEGNTVYAPNGGNGLQTGWEVYGEIYNVWWKDNIVRRGTVDPVSMWVRYIDEEDTKIHNVYYENNKYDDGQLVESLNINSAQKNCQYYEIYWNGQLARYSQSAGECGGGSASPTPKPILSVTPTSTPRPTVFPTPTPKPTGTPSPTPTPPEGDLDGDGDVDEDDYSLLLSAFGYQGCGNTADIDGDCVVGIYDYNILVKNYQGAATPTTAPTPGGFSLTPQPGCNGLFCDDFNDGNYYGWREVDLGQGAFSWSVENGRLKEQSDNGETVLLSPYSSDSQSYELSVAAKTGGEYNNFLGIVFGYLNPSNYFAFLWEDPANYYGTSKVKLVKMVNGNETVLAQNSSPGMVADSWYELKVKVGSGQTKVDVNGQEVLSASQTPALRESGVHSDDNDSGVYYDNFVVK